MRLAGYPFVVVRIACRRCHRRGCYRLARLAARYGSELTMIELLAMISADCRERERRPSIYSRCGAFFPDLVDPSPPDHPDGVGRVKLRLIS